MINLLQLLFSGLHVGTSVHLSAHTGLFWLTIDVAGGRLKTDNESFNILKDSE